MSGDQSSDTAAERPVVRVRHGSPSDEEIAILVALLCAAGSGGAAAAGPERPRSRWSAPDVRLRSTGPGHGAWRFSGMPR